MTMNIFVFKGDLNGKMVVVRFFFCRVYTKSASQICYKESNFIFASSCFGTHTQKHSKNTIEKIFKI